MYILKQLFFSISVNSGFGNIYLAAFAAQQIFSHYSPRFQRIIVKYPGVKIYSEFSFLVKTARVISSREGGGGGTPGNSW